MDGIHDLGGREGFGPVMAERSEPVFHHEWERRAWGLTMGTFVMGLSNGGQFRHGIERMDPVHYLTSRYYEHWVTGVATRLVETGKVEVDELERRVGGPVPLSRPEATIGGEAPPPATFFPEVGDRVRVRTWHPRGHTRCPQYVRGKAGTVVRLGPSASLPDLEAHSEERRIEPTCCVRFGVADLWGTPSADAVHVDLWASYLEPERV
ncbi:MAG TPA: nitrile hydratase subunit beta [Acidimicrobiales bacterium]|nr:nitrile hydratase subunit beta [Acidimicrobiales bacterium]